MINSILFVCTGNSCRSVMAERLLKKIIEEKKIKNIEISSAGISHIEDMPAMPLTLQVLKDEGIDASEHRSRFLTSNLLDESNIVLTMTCEQKDYLRKFYPFHRDKIFTLKEYAENSFLNIEDPIFGTLEIYKICLEKIKEALYNLVKKIEIINKIKILIGADHRGVELKEYLKSYFLEKEIEFKDYGTNDLDSVDYPDIGFSLAKDVVSQKNTKGILICSSGIGMSIIANKVKGIRAALCHNTMMARLSREHNDANILVLGADIIKKTIALEIMKIWLNTNFIEGKHKQRIDKIAKFEME